MRWESMQYCMERSCGVSMMKFEIFPGKAVVGVTGAWRTLVTGKWPSFVLTNAFSSQATFPSPCASGLSEIVVSVFSFACPMSSRSRKRAKEHLQFQAMRHGYVLVRLDMLLIAKSTVIEKWPSFTSHEHPKRATVLKRSKTHLSACPEGHTR